MKLLQFAILATFESTADKRKYHYQSPEIEKENVKGLRLNIGWLFLRIGSFILTGNKGFNTYS